MKERPHKRLDVWKQSLTLVKEIYQVTDRFPSTERYGLTSQMRRSAVSIPVNIAESSARLSNKDNLNFYYIGRASLSELDAHLEICESLGYLPPNEKENLQTLIDRIGMMLSGLIASRARNYENSRNHALTSSR